MVQYGDAGRSNATTEDAVPGLGTTTGVDYLIKTQLGPLLNMPQEVAHSVLLNFGVNDMALGNNTDAVDQLPNETVWNTDYEAILTYAHGLWPNAIMRISYPWRAGFDNQAAAMHSRVDTVIAWCGTHGIDCRPGVDEAITIKGSDNGFLETDSSTGGAGVHYSNPFGVGLYAAAMQAALGF